MAAASKGGRFDTASSARGRGVESGNHGYTVPKYPRREAGSPFLRSPIGEPRRNPPTFPASHCWFMLLTSQDAGSLVPKPRVRMRAAHALRSASRHTPFAIVGPSQT